MDFNFLIGFFIYMKVTGALSLQYKHSRVVDTWENARDGCQEFGGHLATLKNLDQFRHLMITNSSDVIMEDGTELWVGGVLVDLGWHWAGNYGNGGVTPNAAARTIIVDRGCFKQSYWTGGQTLPGITAEACFNTCRWKGAVGLKKNYCICEKDLRNVTKVEPSLCHFTCAGNQAEECGGLFGVSIYQTTSRSISWAADEPKPNNDCVYIRRRSPGSPLEWVTSNCDLQTRFLCRFENDDKCGLSDTCVRWATQHATWEQSRQKCKDLYGHLAEIDIAHASEISDKLPPGTFWIALKRQRMWRWNDGTEIPLSNFYGHERQINPTEPCAVIQNIRGSYGFSARSCLLKRNYLCQYDYMKSPSIKRSDIDPNVKSPSTKATFTSANGLTTSMNYDKKSDVDVIKSGDNGGTEFDGLPKAEKSSISDNDGLLTTCMYVAVGFISGVAFILLAGLALYCCVRYWCPKPSDQKVGEKNKRGQGRVSYSTDHDSVKMTVGQDSDGIYDTVYDLQKESPFRRTQRLIRMGSATNFRHAPARRPTSDVSDSSESICKYAHGNVQRQRSDAADNASYLWRGEVSGGKIEVINTELREDPSSSRHRFDDVSYVVHNQVRCKPILKDSLQFSKPAHGATRSPMEDDVSEYEFGTSEPYGVCPRPSSHYDHSPNSYQDKAYPSFVEMEAKLSELANEENLYASIKRTLPKHKTVQTTNLDSSDDDIMY